MTSWQIMPLFMWAPIHSVIYKICLNTTVIKQGIPLCRCTITYNCLTFLFCLYQKIEDISFDCFNFSSKSKIMIYICVVSINFMLLKIIDPIRNRFYIIFLVSGINPQRTSMSRQFFHIKYSKPMRSKNLFYCEKGKIREMFMVNSIKLRFLHQSHKMRKLHCNNTIWLKENF